METFTWRKYVESRSSAGAIVNTDDNYTSNGILHGEFLPVSGSKGQAYGAVRGQTDVTVTLRQFPALQSWDRLVHRRTNQEYQISGIKVDYPNKQTIVDLTTYEGEPGKDQ